MTYMHTDFIEVFRVGDALSRREERVARSRFRGRKFGVYHYASPNESRRGSVKPNANRFRLRELAVDAIHSRRTRDLGCQQFFEAAPNWPGKVFA